jgi:hypothetical protein
MKKITLLLAATVFSFSAFSQGLLYTFDSVKTTSGIIDPSPVPMVSGVVCGSFSAVGTPLNSLAAARFDFANWPLGSIGGTADTLYSGMTGSISTAEYYEVTLTPAAGYTITGDSIKFTFEHSLTGVRTYSVRSSTDGYTTNLTALYGVPTTNVTVQTGNVFFLKRDNITGPQTRNIIVLGGASFTNISTPITFRFYGWNAKASSGTFSIDNVNFIGSSALATGITEKTINTVAIYPNPSTTGVFTLDLTTTSNKTIITVYDIVGKIISTREVDSSAKQQIDLSNQANGCYFVNIKNDSGIMTKKITLAK